MDSNSTSTPILLGDEARRAGVLHRIDALVNEGGFTNAIVVAGAVHSPSSLRRAIPSFHPGMLIDVERELGEMEDKNAIRLERERAEAERDARRHAPPDDGPDPMEPVYAARRAEVAAIAEREASVEGRLEKIETLLARVAEALEKR